MKDLEDLTVLRKKLEDDGQDPIVLVRGKIFWSSALHIEMTL